MRRLILSCLMILILPFYSLAFQRTVYTSQLYQEILTSNKESIVIEKVKLVDDISSLMKRENIDFYEALETRINRNIESDTLGLISTVKNLFLYDLSGNSVSLEYVNIPNISISKGAFQEFSIRNITAKKLYIDSLNVNDAIILHDSVIDEFTGFDNETNHFEVVGNIFKDFFKTDGGKVRESYWIMESNFEDGAKFSTAVEGDYIDFRIEASDFYPLDSELRFPLDNAGREGDTLTMKNQVSINLYGKVNQAVITDNVFMKDSIDQYFSINGEFDYMIVSANEIGVTMHPNATVTKQLIMDENEFTSNFIFTDFILEGRNNILRWSEIAGFKLASHVQFGSYVADEPELFGYTEEDIPQILKQTGGYLQRTYKAASEVELDDLEPYQRLLSSYYRLYKAFKENGDLDQANEVYVEMKDVQLKELSYQYNTYGGLESWIEWRLNYILKVYTDYGTKPAKAIRLSVWVVLLFSIFYFFFPSEWDTKSKGQLIDDYKALVEKNEKGYFLPFLKLSFGFSKSLMNAFTLSLNSFVTLGFGSIPTTGLARYICILQGFLGWFLLSIFTASLINQVLF